jgi:SAM-dependent methyltransferase
MGLSAPTTILPPLIRLSTHPAERIKYACQTLRDLYFPPAPPSALLDSKFTIPQRSIHHSIHDKSVPDSGYASAEEDEDEDAFADGDNSDCAYDSELEILQADPLERAFAIKWLTGFITRSDIWIASSESDEDAQVRAGVLEEAASLLSAFTGSEGDEDVALTRTFSFPIHSDRDGSEIASRKIVAVELNDAPLSKDDHTSVGLQSWGSSILLADRLCLEPDWFSLTPRSGDDTLRILELGAGTGMLSIVASKILQPSPVEIVATDYHPDVLGNLTENVKTNFPSSQFPRAPITVTPLDWEHPSYDAPLDRPFDIILAADVIYHPSHAKWIKQCVERLLSRPGPATDCNGGSGDGGVFWLIIPVRTTGRHEGMSDTVDALFPRRSVIQGGSGQMQLAILHREEVGRQGSVGRADEGAYRLFKIGWVN